MSQPHRNTQFTDLMHVMIRGNGMFNEIFNQSN